MLSLFFESSTRTSSSFELAAKRLSADVISLKAAGRRSKGRVAEGHDPHARAVRAHAIVRRHPQAGAPARRALHRCGGRERGGRQAPAPDAGFARPLHDAPALGELEHLHVAIVGDVLHSRVALALIQALRACRCPDDAGRAADPDPARDRIDGLRGHVRDRRDRGRRISTCSGCSASGWSRRRAEPARVRGPLGRDA